MTTEIAAQIIAAFNLGVALFILIGQVFAFTRWPTDSPPYLATTKASLFVPVIMVPYYFLATFFTPYGFELMFRVIGVWLMWFILGGWIVIGYHIFGDDPILVLLGRTSHTKTSDGSEEDNGPSPPPFYKKRKEGRDVPGESDGSNDDTADGDNEDRKRRIPRPSIPSTGLPIGKPSLPGRSSLPSLPVKSIGLPAVGALIPDLGSPKRTAARDRVRLGKEEREVEEPDFDIPDPEEFYTEDDIEDDDGEDDLSGLFQ